MARVLLTGARGFIGRQCRALLVGDGWEVHAVASSPSEDDGPQPDDGAIWHVADLLDPAAVRRVVERTRPSHLLHLAWYTVPGDLYHSSENERWVEAGRELLDAVGDQGIRRAVVAGSCAEYDWSDGLCSETGTPLEPATAYGRAKNALRAYFEEWAAQPGRSGAWARLFFLYGPGEHPNRLVPSVARALLADRPAECTHGEQRRDYLYVGDAAAALVRLLGSEVRGPINIASGVARPLKEVIGAVASELDRPDLVLLGARPAPAHEPPLIVADVTRQSRELRWQPATSLAGGVAATVAWWRRELARSSSHDGPHDGSDEGSHHGADHGAHAGAGHEDAA